jgi:hypothetical protein
MDKMRRVTIIPEDALEEQAYRALQKILKHKKARSSVSRQLIKLAHELGDDDDPSHQVMHKAC